MRSRQGLAAIYENTLENEMPNINFFCTFKRLYVQLSISMRLG